MTHSSKSSKDSGNTKPRPKQISPAKHWCFTYNNYQPNSTHILIQKFQMLDVHRYWFKKEVGELKTKHIQGYLIFKTKKRPKEAVGIPQIHWEKKRGTKQEAIAYIYKKDTTDPDDPTIYTNEPKLHSELEGKELYDWEKDLLELVDEEPHPRHIWWIYGPPCGKSTFAKHLAIEKGAIYMGGEAHDIRCGIALYLESNPDRITQNNIFIFDIPADQFNNLSYVALEQIKNGAFFSGKYKGGMVLFKKPHCIVFCNYKPQHDRMMQDRFMIHQVGQ